MFGLHAWDAVVMAKCPAVGVEGKAPTPSIPIPTITQTAATITETPTVTITPIITQTIIQTIIQTITQAVQVQAVQVQAPTPLAESAEARGSAPPAMAREENGVTQVITPEATAKVGLHAPHAEETNAVSTATEQANNSDLTLVCTNPALQKYNFAGE